MKTVNLCFLGFGNVARTLVALLEKKRATLRDQYAFDYRITGIASRRLGWMAAPDGLDVAAFMAGQPIPHVTPEPTDITGWLKAAQADVMFENTPSEPQTGQPATDYIRAALNAGVHTITANKGPTIHAYRELTELAAAKGKRFLFEASVMGGAPIFSLFRETLPALTIQRFKGILNSTTTFILTQMESGKSFDESVKEAQARGMTETDPSLDVDGWDAAVKVAALSTVLMGVPLKINDVQREGIRGLDAETVRSARAAGTPYKLVARLERTGSGVTATVRPEQVPVTEAMGNIVGSTLLAQFETDILPALTITTHKPNLETTAYDLMADLVTAVRPS